MHGCEFQGPVFEWFIWEEGLAAAVVGLCACQGTDRAYLNPGKALLAFRLAPPLLYRYINMTILLILAQAQY